MDDQKYFAEKKRILANVEGSVVFQAIRDHISYEMHRPGQHAQIPFSFNDQYRACIEWGWPQDPEYYERVIMLVMAYLKTLEWKFRIRNIQESNLLPEHHGIGSRIDDQKVGKQWSGILVKQYDSVLAKGDKDVQKAKKIEKGNVTALPKQKSKAPDVKPKNKGGLGKIII